MSRVEPENHSAGLKALLHSYLSAVYRLLEPEIDLRIGATSPDFEAWLLSLDQDPQSWGIITAWNPASVVRSKAENRAANRQLANQLTGHDHYAIEAHDGSTEFPPERGFLVLDIEPDEIASLALQFGQNAVVHARRDQPPRLLIQPLVWKQDWDAVELPEYVDIHQPANDNGR